MKQVRIIKQKRNVDVNETTTESKKPEEPSTRKIMNTVKGWIEESQQRKTTRRFSLTALQGQYQALGGTDHALADS